MVFVIGKLIPIFCKCKKWESPYMFTGSQGDVNFLCIPKGAIRISLIVSSPSIVERTIITENYQQQKIPIVNCKGEIFV
jgi:hypothetical protein